MREKDSALEAFISGRHSTEQKNGIPYADRDPQVFSMIINFLKNDKQLPSLQAKQKMKLLQELEFWGLMSTEKANITYLMNSFPENCQSDILSKWTPIDISKIEFEEGFEYKNIPLYEQWGSYCG